MAAVNVIEILSTEIFLSSQEDLPKTSCGKLVNVCHFYSFHNVAAEPDHLLSWFVKDIVQVCITFLGTDLCRKQVDNFMLY